uniref:Disease resistance protein RPM1 n=1 Tax=Triticum urartu TaxID=4572 RepID=A0A8R7RBM9_TRIUA
MPRVETILKISLEDLPYDLKNCLLHCALFPEDYSIKRRTIMRHWIAAGFIKEKENKTLEEVAEGYLTELVNRSLLQVVKRNYTGRLKWCQMHDVIRLVALNKAGEECFGKVYDGSGVFCIERTRRISIQSRNLERLSESDATRVRAIHVFNRYLDIDLLKPILESSNLLSTLDLQGTHVKLLPAEVFNLFNLRYLGLRNTDIESLPEEIGRLQNLVVLDSFNAALSCLPNNIVKLQRLRYLFACNVGQQGELNPFSGVKVPSGIRHLTSLHALQCVEANSEILRGVAALTQLRTFAVCNVETKHSADLRNAIKEMRHLQHLQITAMGEKEVLQLEGLVNVVGLEGQLEKTSIPQVISSWSRLNSLTWLKLAFSKIDEESFSSLLMLHGLCHLSLLKAFEGKKMHFAAGSFPKLRNLSIRDAPQLNQVEIEEGAMASLAKFKLVACPDLKFLPHGVEHLAALEELYLRDTSEELIEKLQQKREPKECTAYLRKIRHIKRVTVVLTKNGLQERIR